MYNNIFYTIIVIIIANYIIERVISYLNSRRYAFVLPEELQGVYDDEKYEKSQKYKRENAKFAIITSTFNFIIIMCMLFFKGFAFVDDIARNISGSELWITIIFFVLIMFASNIINIPFSIYSTFVIEEKYGFNKTTVKTFILDKIKGWLLGLIIGGGIMVLIVKIYLKTGSMFWIYTWIVISGFSVFMAMFYSSIIVPIFNKQTPLEDGKLKDEIKKMAESTGFKLDNIYVIDGSKRSTKANAYFSGLGPKKRIVLFDTLIKDLTTREIVSVLAHEIGHYKLKHTLSTILLSIIQTGITFYIFSLLVDNPLLSKALGTDHTGFHLGLITFGILYSPISMIIGLGLNALSRKNEYAADSFAGKYYDGELLINSLKKLSSNSLSNLTPHPAYVFFHYSHPTLLQRIRALRSKMVK